MATTTAYTNTRLQRLRYSVSTLCMYTATVNYYYSIQCSFLNSKKRIKWNIHTFAHTKCIRSTWHFLCITHRSTNDPINNSQKKTAQKKTETGERKKNVQRTATQRKNCCASWTQTLKMQAQGKIAKHKNMKEHQFWCFSAVAFCCVFSISLSR